MKQPKYSPTEALNKIKLMMNYDLSKTLKENVLEVKSIIKEDTIDTDTEKSVEKMIKACSGRAEAEGTLDAASIASAFNRAFNYQTAGFLGGTDDSLWRAQASIMKKGNLDDLCNITREFEDLGYGNFAQKLVDELDDEELAELMETFSAMSYRTKKEGRLAVASTEQKDINWFKKSFPCIFDSDANVDQRVLKNVNNYVYILIKGDKGNLYQVFSDGRIKTNQGKITGKKISCNGSKIGFIAESIEKKKFIEEQFSEDELLGSGGSTPSPKPKPKPGPKPEKNKLEKGAVTLPGDPYQYKYENGVWFTKGLLPAGIAKIPNWKSLADNKKATEILNGRHPELNKSKEEVKKDVKIDNNANIEDVDGEDPNKI